MVDRTDMFGVRVDLRQHRHNIYDTPSSFLTKQYTVTESDFIVRMLYKDVH